MVRSSAIPPRSSAGRRSWPARCCSSARKPFGAWWSERAPSGPAAIPWAFSPSRLRALSLCRASATESTRTGGSADQTRYDLDLRDLLAIATNFSGEYGLSPAVRRPKWRRRSIKRIRPNAIEWIEHSIQVITRRHLFIIAAENRCPTAPRHLFSCDDHAITSRSIISLHRKGTLGNLKFTRAKKSMHD